METQVTNHRDGQRFVEMCFKHRPSLVLVVVYPQNIVRSTLALQYRRAELSLLTVNFRLAGAPWAFPTDDPAAGVAGLHGGLCAYIQVRFW